MIGGLFKSASRVAIVAAAGIFAGSMSAQAADLGGNCCADLEERVAELEATTARKGNRRVSLTVYGQVNKAIIWHDDESVPGPGAPGATNSGSYREGKLTVIDNAAGHSRFGFRGSAKIRPDLEAGYQIEVQVNENASTSGLTIRHNFVYLDSSTMGRVSLGQTSQVTDGLFEINLANTQVTPAGTGGMDAAETFLDSTYASTFVSGVDGGRKQGVYYRTPTLAGFILSAGYSHDADSGLVDSTDFWEVALRYAGEFNGIRLAAGIGYRHEDLYSATVAGENEIWMASGSIMHTPTGLFVSGGYGDVNSSGFAAGLTRDRTHFWVMGGIEKNWFGPGATTLFAEYGDADVARATINDGTVWGLGVAQKFDAAAMDLYLNYRNYELEGVVPATVDSSANVVVGGMIIRF